MIKKYLLHDKWEFSLNKKCKPVVDNIKPGIWYKASVPGTVHTDLINNNLIPDPFYSDNERNLQWIGEMDWDYRKIFELPKSFDLANPVYIIFDGIDTMSDVFINGEKIGSTKNMFCSYEFDVSRYLKKKNNKLLVHFVSPYKYAREIEAKYGKLPVALNSERVYIRKAQYSFGWDWGPSLATSGLWKDVYLMQKSVSFINQFTFNTIRLSDQGAVIEIKGNVENPNNINIKLKIIFSKDNYVYEKEIEIKEKLFIHGFEIDNPKLWWPNGYGNPELYNLTLQLWGDNILLDEKISKVGIRTVDLQLKDAGENTFRLIVNDEHIFARGTDWIPADLFIPRVSKEKYKRLIEYAKNGSMNIMRVWGGGFYENDVFYDLCDEMGILVWQDFMFACAAYPEFPAFIENCSEEFRQNIKRLQNHPSLAIWCGNNENEWNWMNEQHRPYREMPGYNIYHDIIPDILNKLDPKRPYWPSSPFGFDVSPNSVLSGNRHQWEIWSMWKDYNHVSEDKSLFVTEFGFQAPANRLTLEEVISVRDRNVQSEIFEFHNKQVEGNERLFRFLSGHLPVKTKWEDFIYLTQLNQGFALKTCIQHWRSNYPITNGSIIWQHNDCWPVSSWALIDSNLIPKQSYYHVKNIFNQQIVTFVKKEKSIEVLIINNSLKEFSGSAKIQIINLAKGKIEFSEFKELKSKSNSKDVISSIADYTLIDSGVALILVSVYDDIKALVHRNYYTGKEWKHMSLPNAEVSLKKTGDDSLIVETDKPAFFITLEANGISFDNNSFILLPGEKEIIKTSFIKDVKLKLKNISVISLNNYLR